MLVAFGVSALITASLIALVILKIGGAGHLLWLAKQAVRFGSKLALNAVDEPKRTRRSNVPSGLWSICLIESHHFLHDLSAAIRHGGRVWCHTEVGVPRFRSPGPWLQRNRKVLRRMDSAFAVVFSIFAAKISSTQARRRLSPRCRENIGDRLAVSRGVAELVGGTGVTVNTVLLGPTRSEILSNWMKATAEVQGTTQVESEQNFLKTMRSQRSSIDSRRPSKSLTWRCTYVRNRLLVRAVLDCVSMAASFAEFLEAKLFCRHRGATLKTGLDLGHLPRQSYRYRSQRQRLRH